MTPGNLPLTIIRGVDWQPILLNFQDGSSNPINLTGWGIFACGRMSLSGPVILDLEPTIVNATAGQAQLGGWTFEETESIPMIGTFYWDLVLLHSNGMRLGPYLAGELDIVDINTRPSS